MSWILPKPLAAALTVVLFVMTPLVANAQATSRTCSAQAGEVPGPACLVAHQDIGALPETPLYWTIFTFADVEAAERVRPRHGVVVQAFSQVWMFDLGAEGRQFEGGKHVADVGPLPLETTQGEFTAEYLKSTFAPGMTAPVRVHSGPEAFYAISGASCL